MLFIGGLPSDVRQTHIVDLFAGIAKVRRCLINISKCLRLRTQKTMLIDLAVNSAANFSSDKPANVGVLVGFKTPSVAKKVMDMHHFSPFKYGGHELLLRYKQNVEQIFKTPSVSLFMEIPSPQCTSSDITQALERYKDDIQAVHIRTLCEAIYGFCLFC